jgi:hypothetical protein
VPIQAAKRGKERLASIRGIGVGASGSRESTRSGGSSHRVRVPVGRGRAGPDPERLPRQRGGATCGRPRRGPGPRGPPAPRKTLSDLQPSRPPSENVADRSTTSRTRRSEGSRQPPRVSAAYAPY